MKTLVISDLHLGSRLQRDVLRRPAALAALQERLDDVDRLVLLGDTVELLEGRPAAAMREAEPVLRALGDALGKGKEVVVVPGNHDHALIRPWLREMRARRRSTGEAGRAPVKSSTMLTELCGWLKPARVSVRYPGVWLGPGVWAHHGHYLDRHLVRQITLPTHDATPEDYEKAIGTSLAAFSAVMASALPPVVGEPVDRVAGLLRQATLAAVPLVCRLPCSGALAPLSAGVLGFQFRRAGLPAMATVVGRLGVEADAVLFGHVHRAGPRFGDTDVEWTAPSGARLHNSGCWVYEPLLLGGARPPHPYWPGGALLVDGTSVSSLGILDGVDPAHLR